MTKNDFLNTLPRIYAIEEANQYDTDVFLLPKEFDYYFTDDDLIELSKDGKIFGKVRDLIRVIEIVDSLENEYKKTNILTPLMYAESCENIPWHITTQGMLFTKLSESGKQSIQNLERDAVYQAHEMDHFWLSCSKSLADVTENDVVGIFNRRVGGWDGSLERPVIELLGAGGHLPTVFEPKVQALKELSFQENFIKEFQEELGLTVQTEDIIVFGGFTNKLKHELVVLCGIFIAEEDVVTMQEYAAQHIDDDTNGIYLGTFFDTIAYYLEKPDFFAGGQKAVSTNFATNKPLMERVKAFLR